MDKFQIKKYNTIIIGAGAAGLNCAIHLVEEGLAPDRIAIVTESLGSGTSFNTGSDKQTYYKLSLIGGQVDSPLEMANDLFKGGAMHGDIALIEASNSVREFFHLVQLGVPFPHDEYGGFVGYKTDYDPRQRATSIGPLTSQEMSIRLLDEVRKKGIKIFNNYYAVRVLVDQNESFGLICLKIKELSNNLEEKEFIQKSVETFLARNIVIATGGPAKLYKNSVYPISQSGTTNLAIEAGCKLQNLTESQFGLASNKYRWNVSGSYQQVIPRYFSLDDENNQYEFLNNYFPSFNLLSRAIFLKGYQWPFNSERIENHGSSLLDLAVYYETEILGRYVFLDYTQNPSGFNFDDLDDTAKAYLCNSKAMGDKPIDRLYQMNERAIKLYKNRGIDITKEPLQIAVCNQHLNGGIAGNIWWESSVKYLFAIGEINGSHGIHRPGGAALNAGQVGGLRAAQKIAHSYNQNDYNEKSLLINDEIAKFTNEIKELFQSSGENKLNAEEILLLIQERMERYGTFIRPMENLEKEIETIQNQLANLSTTVRIKNNLEVLDYFKIKDKLTTQLVFLKSILEYHKKNGGSRGSYLIIRPDLSENANQRFIEPPGNLKQFKYIVNNLDLTDKILTIQLNKEMTKSNKTLFFDVNWVEVRKIPKDIGWFETTWKKFNEKDIYK
jgi:succinate dehydrogenase/fumarate reductase flavoprotein subunit